MANVRISTNWQHNDRMEWAGAPAIGKDGCIERAIPMPEDVYCSIEAGISSGHMEGDVYLPDRSHFHWFLDR